MACDDVIEVAAPAIIETSDMLLRTSADIKTEHIGASAGRTAKGAAFDVLYLNKRRSMRDEPFATGRLQISHPASAPKFPHPRARTSSIRFAIVSADGEGAAELPIYEGSRYVDGYAVATICRPLTCERFAR